MPSGSAPVCIANGVRPADGAVGAGAGSRPPVGAVAVVSTVDATAASAAVSESVWPIKS